MRALASLLASTSTISALCLAAAPAGAQSYAAGDPPATVDVKDWKVPWEKTRPRDPYVDAQGRVWFVGQEGNYIAYLDPTSGRFKRYEIEAGTHPHNLIVDAKGMVWYAGNRNARIGRLDPRDGKVTTYMMPDGAARDPHTLAFDPRGDIWFTVQGGNFVGKLTTATGRVQLVKMPTEGARPYGIVVDRTGRPWFDEFGTNRIGTIDPATMELKEYPLPHDRARPRRIARTSDGRVWYVDYTRGYLGALDPANGRVEEWAAPSGARSMPYAMTVDDRDRLWFVETGVQPNRLVGFDPKTRAFFGQTDIPGDAPNTVRHMIYHAPTKSIWYGSDANTIGRATAQPVVP